MSLKVSTIALSLALAAGASGAWALSASLQDPVRVPPTVEQFAAFPYLSSLSVSPDGRHMVGLEGRGEDQVILVWNTADLTREPVRIGAAEMKIRGVQFIKNDRLAVTLWQTWDIPIGGGTNGTFISKLMITDLQGRNWRDPMDALRTRSEGEAEAARRASPTILDTLPNDPHNILALLGNDVYRINLQTNRGERIHRSGERVIAYDTDLTGELRTRTITDRDSGGLYIATQFRSANSVWDEHIRTYIKDREVFAVAGFSTDPNIAYVVSNRGRDKAAIFEYDIANRRLGEVLFEHPLFEATGVAIETTQGPKFGEILGFGYSGPRSEFYAVDPDLAALRQGVEQALGIEQTPVRIVDPATGRARTIRYANDRYVDIVSYSDDLNTAVLFVGGVNDPGEYFLLRNKTELLPIAKPYPQLDPATLGTTELVYYKARDGLDIPAFLSKPSAEMYGPGPYPMVVMPHGGPWSRDQMDWDGSMWRQLMTSRGYAVLQPQFRGSDGWGDRLWKAGDNEWGQTMQDDLDDGVTWAVAEGHAISDRVAMYGFSYGGYAAMVAGIRPNGLYRCSIAGAGVSDLTKIRSSLFRNPYTREAQLETVNGLNPVTRASEVSIPMLVFHGSRDTTVLLEQSEGFVSAARSSGQDIQYEVIPDYGHGPAWTRAIAAQQLRLVDDYLKNSCGEGGLAAPR
jgi:acetyl esterase/lipase